MANAQLGAGLRMNDNLAWEPAGDTDGGMSSSSPSGFTMTVPGRIFTISGTGFTFKHGDVATGIADHITMRAGAEVLFDATGLNVSFATDYFDTGYGGDQPGWQSELAYWFRDADTVNGSAGNEYLKGFSGNDLLIGNGDG